MSIDFLIETNYLTFFLFFACNHSGRVASPPKEVPQSSPQIHSATPGQAPSRLPGTTYGKKKNKNVFVKFSLLVAWLSVVSVVVKRHYSNQNWPPYEVADHDVPSVSAPPPSINWKRDKMPVAAPSYKTPHLSPLSHTPASGMPNVTNFYLVAYLENMITALYNFWQYHL